MRIDVNDEAARLRPAPANVKCDGTPVHEPPPDNDCADCRQTQVDCRCGGGEG